jgi:two-component system, sensor histidine kinase PdtaS
LAFTYLKLLILSFYVLLALNKSWTQHTDNIYPFRDKLKSEIESIKKIKFRNQEFDKTASKKAPIIQATTYQQEGIFFLRRGEYDKALSIFSPIQKLGKTNRNLIIEGIGNLEFARCLHYQGRYTEAFPLYIQGIQQIENGGNKDYLTYGYTLIGEYYRHIGKYPESEKYIRKALSLIEKEKKIEDLVIINCYHRSAAMYNEILMIDSVKHYSFKALQLNKGRFPYEKAISVNELGFYFENLKDFGEALVLYDEARTIWDKKNYPRDWVNVTENIARTYRKMGKIKESNLFALEAIALAEKNNWFYNLQSLNLLVEGNYFLLGDKLNSHIHESKSLDAQVNMYKEISKRDITELEKKYEKIQYEKELKESQLDLEISELKLESQKKSASSVRLSLVMLLLVMFLLIAYIVLRRRYNEQLELKNKKIQKTADELNYSLKKSELLLQEVHHRVKNNLQIISSLVSLEFLIQSGRKSDEILENIHRRISAIALVHESLYVKDEFDTLNSKIYLQKLSDSLKNFVDSQNDRIEFEFQIDEFSITIDEGVAIGIIISELCSNSLKHAFKEIDHPLIQVKLSKEDTTVQVEYSDNGQEILGAEKNIGLGKTIIQTFINQINATYENENSNGFSCRFAFKSKIDL